MVELPPIKKLSDIDLTGILSNFTHPPKSKYTLPRIAFIGHFRYLSMTSQRDICQQLGFEYFSGIEMATTNEKEAQLLSSKWSDITRVFTKMVVIGHFYYNMPEWRFEYLLYKKCKRDKLPVVIKCKIPVIMEDDLWELHPDYPDISNSSRWDVQLCIQNSWLPEHLKTTQRKPEKTKRGEDIMAGPMARTLTDWTKEIDDPEGKIAAIAERLKGGNSILEDMLWVEGNLPTGHKTTIRSGLPSVTWRQLNYGVQPSKSRTVQVTDTCGMLKIYGEVDKSLADLNGNTREFRMSEDLAFLDDMNQEMAKMVFYGNPVSEPDKFMGLAPRYNSADADVVENAENVIDCGGTGDDNNTSIWLVTWDALTCHGIFPKGQIAGLQHEDQGEVTLTDEDGNPHQWYRTYYRWDMGLVLRDWRYVVRIANIKVDDLRADASASANLITSMIEAIQKVPKEIRGNRVFYCNPTTYTLLDLQTLSHKNTVLTYGKDVHGQEVMKFRGIPVRKCAAIADNEKAI